jgi:hypothetical protein
LKVHHGPLIRVYIRLHLLIFLLIPASLTGCGSGSLMNCTATSLTVDPPTATADHLAASPGNQVQFSGFNNLGSLPSSCHAIPLTVALRTDLKWTSSDPVNVTIGSTQGVDYGLATCKNPTVGPVTITATGPNAANATISGSAMLTCK